MPSTLLAQIAARDAAPFDNERFPILVPEIAQSVLAVIDENLGEGGLRASDLDRITVPTGGGLAFEVPGLDEDPEPAKTISGIILLMAPAKGYWSTSIESGKTPPQCYSNDGITGIGSPGGHCPTCPLNQWGTDTTGSRHGKACKDKQLLYVLQEQSALPIVLALPRTSVSINRKYMTRLSATALPYYGCITQWQLTKVNGPGMAYSQVRPCFQEPIPRDQWPAIRKYADALAAALRTSSQPMIVDPEPPSAYGDQPDPPEAQAHSHQADQTAAHQAAEANAAPADYDPFAEE
ncbi:MAG: hypothetical protein B7Z62_00270 [Deltaproteobacteria bacterium 37-65-8]|nr:MAG: hypothetical protein B7Z62_00270 [Deltaproteobacteria bacterium 37-65-8]